MSSCKKLQKKKRIDAETEKALALTKSEKVSSGESTTAGATTTKTQGDALAKALAEAKVANENYRNAKLKAEAARNSYNKMHAASIRGKDDPWVLFASIEVLNVILEFESAKTRVSIQDRERKSFILNNAEQIRGLLSPCLKCAASADYGNITEDMMDEANALTGQNKFFLCGVTDWCPSSSLAISNFICYSGSSIS